MSNSPSRYLFTLTAGRTGTHYLTELLRKNLSSAEVHHEILGFQSFGVHTPDVSHMTLFNSRGNVERVREFWAQKLERIRQSNWKVYAETSHLLMKAGLVENLAPLLESGEVHLIDLRRDPVKTISSYLKDHHFANRGMWWMWYLDPAYPNKIIEPGRLPELGIEGVCIWYVLEVQARAEYYRLLMEGEPRVHIHQFDLEDLNTAAGTKRLFELLGENPGQIDFPDRQSPAVGHAQLPDDFELELQKLLDRLAADPAALAQKFFDSGRRLEAPGRTAASRA